jgi:hypothetical protein
MAITITLPPATEAWLRAEAEATGKNIDILIIEAVQSRLRLSDLRLRHIRAPVHADLQESGLSEAELNELLRESLEEVRKTPSPQADASA